MFNLSNKTIGRYQIIDLLGRGGMAVVYRARDTRLDRTVALKLLLSVGSISQVTLKRFEREALTLANLSHPNIIHIHDYGEYDGIPYLVMEYIPGGTLLDKLILPLPHDQAASLLAPIASALGYAHRHGVIHRDVKPRNILMRTPEDPVLTDFGIAKKMDGVTLELTGTGLTVGTPGYMAPEQWKGKEVDEWSDIYSLGVVYYELVTGRKPYEADTPAALMFKQLTEPLTPAKDINPRLPETVDNIINRALAKEPIDRHANAQDLERDLENIAQPYQKKKEVETRSLREAEQRKAKVKALTVKIDSALAERDMASARSMLVELATMDKEGKVEADQYQRRITVIEGEITEEKHQIDQLVGQLARNLP